MIKLSRDHVLDKKRSFIMIKVPCATLIFACHLSMSAMFLGPKSITKHSKELLSHKLFLRNTYKPNIVKNTYDTTSEKAFLEEKIMKAHGLMLPPINLQEGPLSNQTYSMDQFVIANALSASESLNDNNSIWLWPENLTPLLNALQNNGGIIRGIDKQRNILSTFYSWNFPFHKLQQTLHYYQFDTHMDDPQDEAKLVQAYTEIIKTVNDLCNKRFGSTCDLFGTSDPLVACKEYHLCVRRLKKITE